MRRHRTLIASPLKWQMSAAPVSHPAIPVLAERGGTQLKTPRPVVLVDTREQNPFDFSRFEGWFAGIEKRALKLGDYSVAGLEDHCVVERKDLADLVHSLTTGRSVFLDRLRLMSRYNHRLLVITASWSEVKSPYTCAGGSPNRITSRLLPLSPGYRFPSCAVRLTNWERNLLRPTSIRFISTIGLRPTTTAASSRTAIFEKRVSRASWNEP